MTWQPEKLTIDEFERRVKLFPWTGRIREFHVHHTADYKAHWRGAETVTAIRKFHMESRNFRDSAQHVTLAPDGLIWLGRSWNWAPASANGFNPADGMKWNGVDDRERPFMVETAGNFEGDKFNQPDRLYGAQWESLVRMIAAIQDHFVLPPEAIRFHREMQATACPGKLDKTALISAVRAYRDTGALVVPPQASPAG